MSNTIISAYFYPLISVGCFCIFCINREGQSLGQPGVPIFVRDPAV